MLSYDEAVDFCKTHGYALSLSPETSYLRHDTRLALIKEQREDEAVQLALDEALKENDGNKLEQSAAMFALRQAAQPWHWIVDNSNLYRQGCLVSNWDEAGNLSQIVVYNGEVEHFSCSSYCFSHGFQFTLLEIIAPIKQGKGNCNCTNDVDWETRINCGEILPVTNETTVPSGVYAIFSNQAPAFLKSNPRTHGIFTEKWALGIGNVSDSGEGGRRGGKCLALRYQFETDGVAIEELDCGINLASICRRKYCEDNAVTSCFQVKDFMLNFAKSKQSCHDDGSAELAWLTSNQEQSSFRRALKQHFAQGRLLTSRNNGDEFRYFWLGATNFAYLRSDGSYLSDSDFSQWDETSEGDENLTCVAVGKGVQSEDYKWKKIECRSNVFICSLIEWQINLPNNDTSDEDSETTTTAHPTTTAHGTTVTVTTSSRTTVGPKTTITRTASTTLCRLFGEDCFTSKLLPSPPTPPTLIPPTLPPNPCPPSPPNCPLTSNLPAFGEIIATTIVVSTIVASGISTLAMYFIFIKKPNNVGTPNAGAGKLVDLQGRTPDSDIQAKKVGKVGKPFSEKELRKVVGQMIKDYMVQNYRDLRGEKGEQGHPGKNGEQGPAGKGEQGPRGERGPQGEKGKDGELRLAANNNQEILNELSRHVLKGAKGDKGDLGGPSGGISIEQLREVIGPVVDKYVEKFHPRGRPGPRGEKGLPGEQGIRGDRGEQGPQGPPGPLGQKGPPGDPGPTGEQGPRGVQGPTGVQGGQGPRGDKGHRGDPGPPGSDGLPGKNGEDYDPIRHRRSRSNTVHEHIKGAVYCDKCKFPDAEQPGMHGHSHIDNVIVTPAQVSNNY